jgi:hypothetical protein
MSALPRMDTFSHMRMVKSPEFARTDHIQARFSRKQSDPLPFEPPLSQPHRLYFCRTTLNYRLFTVQAQVSQVPSTSISDGPLQHLTLGSNFSMIKMLQTTSFSDHVTKLALCSHYSFNGSAIDNLLELPTASCRHPSPCLPAAPSTLSDVEYTIS